jgi:hypothetical protein
MRYIICVCVTGKRILQITLQNISCQVMSAQRKLKFLFQSYKGDIYGAWKKDLFAKSYDPTFLLKVNNDALYLWLEHLEMRHAHWEVGQSAKLETWLHVAQGSYLKIKPDKTETSEHGTLTEGVAPEQ